MSDHYLLLTPFLVLGVLALAGFVGCDKVFGLSAFSVDNPVVTGETLMDPRNDFTGWVGMVIVPQGTDRNVTAIGRYCLAGNTGSHDLKIVDANGVDVPNTKGVVELFGKTPNQFVYAALDQGPALKANLKYYVLSYETSGGDQFYDFTTTVSLSSDNFFAVSSAVFGDPTAMTPIPYTETGGPNQSYGPVDIHYEKAD
jgi:hypothetical protein